MFARQKIIVYAPIKRGNLSVTDIGQCGQNIFTVSTEVPWSFAVRVWDVEKYNFSYGGIRNNSVGLNGHYTQLVCMQQTP